MTPTIPATIVYVVGVLCLYSGLFVYKKSDKEQRGALWLVVNIVLIMCYHTLVAGLIQVVSIPVNNVSIGLIDLVSGVILWVLTLKRKSFQHYTFRVTDVVALVILGYLCYYFVDVHYAGDLWPHYGTIDPAAHLLYAMDIVNNQAVDRMYYTALNNALLIETLGISFIPSHYYKIMLIDEGLQLFMSGAIFYAFGARHSKKFYTDVISVILAGFYMWGYPRSNAQFGFNYLGMGVTLVGVLILLTDFYLSRELNEKWCIFYLMLGCLGMFQCYSLYVPFVYIAIFAAINIDRVKQHVLFGKLGQTILLNLAIFLIPCIYGLVYTYGGVFTADGVSVSNAINEDGAIYRELFSNFLFIGPLSLLGVYMGIKRKENQAYSWTLIMALLQTGALLVGVYTGYVSTYYYYKMYYLLWLLFYCGTFYVACHSEKEMKVAFTGGLALWVAGYVAWYTGLEVHFDNHSETLTTDTRLDNIYSIYENNRYYDNVESFYNINALALYDYVSEELLLTGVTDEVIISAYWEDVFWYDVITNQRWDYTDENLMYQAEPGDYVLVITWNNTNYEENKEYYNSLEWLYSTSMGFVAILE